MFSLTVGELIRFARVVRKSQKEQDLRQQDRMTFWALNVTSAKGPQSPLFEPDSVGNMTPWIFRATSSGNGKTVSQVAAGTHMLVGGLIGQRSQAPTYLFRGGELRDYWSDRPCRPNTVPPV